MHWLKHRKYRCGFLGRSAETLQKWLINTLQSVGIQHRGQDLHLPPSECLGSIPGSIL